MIVVKADDATARPAPRTPSGKAVRREPPTYSAEEREQARVRRERAADQYKPEKVNILLVAEAPPSTLDRYFYFTDVREQDSLFRYVCWALLGRVPTREAKADRLAELRDRGVFLIDLQQDPRDETPLSDFVPELVERCKTLDPDWIVLIKTTVFDSANNELEKAGLPVSSVRVPFREAGSRSGFSRRSNLRSTKGPSAPPIATRRRWPYQLRQTARLPACREQTAITSLPRRISTPQPPTTRGAERRSLIDARPLTLRASLSRAVRRD